MLAGLKLSLLGTLFCAGVHFLGVLFRHRFLPQVWFVIEILKQSSCDRSLN